MCARSSSRPRRLLRRIRPSLAKYSAATIKSLAQRRVLVLDRPVGQGDAGEQIPVGQKVETEVIELYLGTDGIIHQRTKPYKEYTLEHAREHIELVGRVTGGRKHPVLGDIRGVTQLISKEARHFYASAEGTRFFSALAMLVDSTLTRVLTNFYFQVSRPPHPSRMFTDEAQALEWLTQYVPADWSNQDS